jgi:hypothetical protein
MVLGVCTWKAIVVRFYKNGTKLLECKSLEFGTIISNGFFCIWHYSFNLRVCIRDNNCPRLVNTTLELPSVL